MSESPVRWREDVAEYRCPMCNTWWPLTPEFWRPYSGMKRCRSCWAEYFRMKQRGYTADELVREVRRFKNRIYYAENRDRLRAHNLRWKAENRERIREYNREYRARRREQAA